MKGRKRGPSDPWENRLLDIQDRNHNMKKNKGGGSHNGVSHHEDHIRSKAIRAAKGAKLIAVTKPEAGKTFPLHTQFFNLKAKSHLTQTSLRRTSSPIVTNSKRETAEKLILKSVVGPVKQMEGD